MTTPPSSQDSGRISPGIFCALMPGKEDLTIGAKKYMSESININASVFLYLNLDIHLNEILYQKLNNKNKLNCFEEAHLEMIGCNKNIDICHENGTLFRAKALNAIKGEIEMMKDWMNKIGQDEDMGEDVDEDVIQCGLLGLYLEGCP